MKAAEAEAKARDLEAKAVTSARVKSDKQAAEHAAKEEAERIAAEKAKQKKKPIRYPTEDLDVRIGDREKRQGMLLQKPVPHRGPDKLPFSEVPGAFDDFLSTWNFFMCYGWVHVLNLVILLLILCDLKPTVASLHIYSG